MMRRVDTYGIPAVFITDALLQKFREVEEFLEQEALDFNPYRRPLIAHELLQVAKEKFGLAMCSNVEFHIHWCPSRPHMMASSARLATSQAASWFHCAQCSTPRRRTSQACESGFARGCRATSTP
jgi:hypothetical protein